MTTDLNNVIAYYNKFNETNRLNNEFGCIEFIRSKEIIQRYLTKTNLTILDIGGASGKYSFWLAELGHKVHLVDTVPLHIETAKKIAEESGTQLESYNVGDARKLDFSDSFADVVLLMGPLYHLTNRDDRIEAIKEAFRVLKQNGILIATAISRFASTINGLIEGYYKDGEFRKIMLQGLHNGQHRNPTNKIEYFTDAFFHHPKELEDEISSAGFKVDALFAIEGISYMLKDFNSSIKSELEFVLDIIRKTERDVTLLGASPHLMCTAVKK